MNPISSLSNPIINTFETSHSLLKHTLIILSGVLLLTISAQLSIPMYPVPLTFQSATVVLIGMMYGPRYGMHVVLTYLLSGMIGMPVFANFSTGAATLFSSGYLIGFLPAAMIAGYLTQKGFAQHFMGSFFIACISTSVIFSLGYAVLAYQIGWHPAFVFGILPFVISEPIKLIAVACVAPKWWKQF